jgi:preprotein translocase subunit SecD
MQRNLMVKTIVIVATVLVCLFGIFGLPRSMAQLKSNLDHNIHLGLDLKGGSHLVLQVQVQDAAKTTADQAIEALREAARSANIIVDGYDRNDPQTLEETNSIQINIHGVDQTKTSAFRAMVAEKFPDWVLTPVSATDYKMNLKPSVLVDLKRNTVAQETDTISRRVNELGLTEPTVQAYGAPETQSEILVELPGVDDPARVKDLIGTTAQLKIVEVKREGPWKTKEEALAAKGGILQIGTQLLEWPNATNGSQWYLVSSSPVITGQDVRSARPATDTDSPGRWECGFTLSQDGGRRFEKFTSWRSCSTTRSAAWPRFRAPSPIAAASTDCPASRKLRIWRWCCARARCRPESSICRSGPSDRRWAPIRFGKASMPRWRA